MKVALVSQVPLAFDAGGLEVQVLATADALRAAGVAVEFLDPWKRTFDADLLHCFGSDYQLGETASRAKARGIPMVVSAVFAPHRPDVFYRAWRVVDGCVPMKTSFRARVEILRAADAVVALTAVEAGHLEQFFGVDRDRTRVIPNGVDERFFHAVPEAFAAAHRVRGFALSVASVEPLKNQVRLVEALAGTGVPLVMIGAPRAREQAYSAALARVVRERPDVLWIKGLPHDAPLLVSAYAAARVHVLPSLVEAQPLAALEAAAAGANLVLSDLPALRATFDRHAWFCDPRSVTSIRRAVLDAHRTDRGARYAERPDWLLSWREVASRLIDVYTAVLRRPARPGT